MKTPIYAHLVNGWNLYDVDDRYLLSIPEVPDDQQIAEEIVRAVNATAWRSPDEHPDGWVLVTVAQRNGDPDPRVIMAMFDAHRGLWRSFAALKSLDAGLVEVTGWMPLPEPKEER